jgi:hypothetical protein
LTPPGVNLLLGLMICRDLFTVSANLLPEYLSDYLVDNNPFLEALQCPDADLTETRKVGNDGAAETEDHPHQPERRRRRRQILKEGP